MNGKEKIKRNEEERKKDNLSRWKKVKGKAERKRRPTLCKVFEKVYVVRACILSCLCLFNEKRQ